MAKHYGVRITYRSSGPPLVEISQRAKTGHAVSFEDIGGKITRAVMIHFDDKHILFQDELQTDFVGADVRDRSARVIQTAFRRFLVAGDPYLAMPPGVRVEAGRRLNV